MFIACVTYAYIVASSLDKDNLRRNKTLYWITVTLGAMYFVGVNIGVAAYTVTNAYDAYVKFVMLCR